MLVKYFQSQNKYIFCITSIQLIIFENYHYRHQLLIVSVSAPFTMVGYSCCIFFSLFLFYLADFRFSWRPRCFRQYWWGWVWGGGWWWCSWCRWWAGSPTGHPAAWLADFHLPNKDDFFILVFHKFRKLNCRWYVSCPGADIQVLYCVNNRMPPPPHHK